MKKVLITYNSKNGTTKKYAEEINQFISSPTVNVTVNSIEECKNEEIELYDVILLGCWTMGLFLFAQHPEQKWVEFAKSIPKPKTDKLAFFTTYKLLTGSMFRNMQKSLNDEIPTISTIFKSKNGLLSGQDKEQLLSLIN